MKWWSVGLLTLALAACATPYNRQGDGYLLPSQLNAHPEQFDGKPVVVRGWAAIGFEKNYLLDQNADADGFPDSSRCLALFDRDNEFFRNEDRYDMRLVEVIGVFRRSLPPNVVMLGGCGTTILDVDTRRDGKPRILRSHCALAQFSCNASK